LTQTQKILQHLQKEPITPLDALNLYSCFRLGARIWDLKKQGHKIETKTVKKNGKTFAQYELIINEQLRMF